VNQSYVQQHSLLSRSLHPSASDHHLYYLLQSKPLKNEFKSTLFQFAPSDIDQSRFYSIYVLNVGYDRKESLESSVRVILIDRQKILADIHCREIIGKLDTFIRLTVQENTLKVLLYCAYLVSERK